MTVEELAASLTRKGIITMATEETPIDHTRIRALIRDGAQAVQLMEAGPGRDLIAHLTHALAEVHEVAVGADNTASKYWRRMSDAEREMHTRELHRFEAEHAMREALELIQPGIWGNIGTTRDVVQARAILSRALNDEEAEK